MPVVVDTSCMIDLRKVDLLKALLQLPCTFVVPDVLFDGEWLCLEEDEKAALCEEGLEVRELTADAVGKASQYFKEHVSLALNDCFVLALAEETQDCAILSGDGSLRQAAESVGIQAHGVLWVTDELERQQVVEIRILHAVLEIFHDDDTIFLPKYEVARRLRRLSRMLRER